MTDKKILVELECPNNIDKSHLFKILKGTGKRTGIPIWKCEYCKQKKQAS